MNKLIQWIETVYKDKGLYPALITIGFGVGILFLFLYLYPDLIKSLLSNVF